MSKAIRLKRERAAAKGVQTCMNGSRSTSRMLLQLHPEEV